MTATSQDSAMPARVIRCDEDASGDYHGMGISKIDYKLLRSDDDAFIIENIFHAPGGPARHLHFEQDEWFYALEGSFVIEIGSERIELNAGDSVLAPRNVPHVWAFVGEGKGRMLIAFLPVGQMPAFFQEVSAANAMPPQDPAVWLAHGMQLIGPPLQIP